MKALLSSVALAAIPLSGLMAPPASAQLFGGGIVYDPTNHAENILQAVRALQQIDNQIRQLTHEIDMIEKMARDLETLPVEVARAIARLTNKDAHHLRGYRHTPRAGTISVRPHTRPLSLSVTPRRCPA